MPDTVSAHGRELTIFQFLKNNLISFHCHPLLLFLLLTQIYRQSASLHLGNHVRWVFQTGILRLRERSGFPKVAQGSAEEPGLGPPVAREEREAPIHCTLTGCLKLIYWHADSPEGLTDSHLTRHCPKNLKGPFYQLSALGKLGKEVSMSKTGSSFQWAHLCNTVSHCLPKDGT